MRHASHSAGERTVQYSCSCSYLFYIVGHVLSNAYNGLQKGGAVQTRWLRCVIALALLGVQVTALSAPAHKYSTRVVRTKYGTLRGVVSRVPRSDATVEVFLGVPYATPPLGSLRYMPPVTPSPWRGTRLADRPASVCPQSPPEGVSTDWGGSESTNGATAGANVQDPALLRMPRARLRHLQRLYPLLVNQSEDCLYLNLYAPRTDDAPTPLSGTSGTGGAVGGLPVLVYIHGESYSWNGGSPYDGGALAGRGGVLVATVNYRLGILGFLKTGGAGSAQGNFGLMDLVAALHWLRESGPAFGGDPDNLTLMGHGTGAALANMLAVSPVAEELIRRAVLLSGCALSPWAVQKEPLAVKRRVAEVTGCHGDLLEHDIAPCLREKSLQDLLAVRLEPPRFLAGFAPFPDGTVLPLRPSRPLSLPQGSALADTAGLELADFPSKALLVSATSTESYPDLNAQDLEFGFNETRRDRILRTYVRNVYHFHLNEIFSALKNEYTDWERPLPGGGFSARDSALELLSDGHGAAPLLRLAQLHSLRGGKGYFVHFRHQNRDQDFPQRFGSVLGEDIPFILGLPGGSLYGSANYSARDLQVSELLVRYITNFARNGDPNGRSAVDLGGQPIGRPPEPFWDSYDTINQLYLELGGGHGNIANGQGSTSWGPVASIRSHYRGHKLSAWLSLIPQLHGGSGGPGDTRGAQALAELPARHHHFQEEGPQYYDGLVRPQSVQRVPARPPEFRLPTKETTSRTTATSSVAGVTTASTECPNASLSMVSPTAVRAPTATTTTNLLKRLASSHYQSYAAALSITIAVGCFLLLLNIVIFAGIYHQRGRGGRRWCRGSSRKHEGCSPGKKVPEDGPAFGEYSCYDDKLSRCVEKRPLADVALCGGHPGDMALRELKSSPPGALRRPEAYNSSPSRASVASKSDASCCSAPREDQSPPEHPSQDIPEPPPPPRSVAPSPAQSTGILRGETRGSTTSKKRVQIQEISV